MKIFYGFLDCLSPVWKGTPSHELIGVLRSVHMATSLPTRAAGHTAQTLTLHSLTSVLGLLNQGPPGATPRPNRRVGRWEGCLRAAFCWVPAEGCWVGLSINRVCHCTPQGCGLPQCRSSLVPRMKLV